MVLKNGLIISLTPVVCESILGEKWDTFFGRKRWEDHLPTKRSRILGKEEGI